LLVPLAEVRCSSYKLWELGAIPERHYGQQVGWLLPDLAACSQVRAIPGVLAPRNPCLPDWEANIQAVKSLLQGVGLGG
jgi:hypothetical protein